MRAGLVVLLFAALELHAQLIPAGSPIPHSTLPPVVFINGYQFEGCPTTFADTFGIADQVLQAKGEVSLFFSTCSLPASSSIEDLAWSFGNFLSGLKYTDGQPVDQVDIVAHSMGGLVLRCYLSGKQNAGGFQPPAATHVRKAVFLATPNFGTPVAAVLPAVKQVDEMASGSAFLFDLATWNDATDDLRGVDAIAAAGNAGTGFLSGTAQFDDGVVPLTSAALRFYGPGRTRVLPYCHISGGGLVSELGVCPSSASGIAHIDSASHESAQIIVSFLSGTDAWQSVGTAAEDDVFLSKDGGLIVAAHDANDGVLNIGSATANSHKLSTSSDQLAFVDMLTAGQVSLAITSGADDVTDGVTLPAGGTEAYTAKPGPLIAGVLPAAAATFPLELAPRMLIAIYGSNLASGTVAVSGTALSVYYVSATQINAVLPGNLSGLAQLTVQTSAGKHSVNILVEAAAPAIFTLDGSGSGAAAAVDANEQSIVTSTKPLRPGDYVELFATGLGATSPKSGLDYAVQQPTVTVAGVDCPVSFAGAAPGFVGLDQINCVIPAGLAASASAPVVVTSGTRVSNTATLAIQ